MHNILDLLKKSTKDSRVTLIAGAFFGALTNVFAVEAAMGLLLLMAIVFGFAFLDQRRSQKQLLIMEEETTRLLRPNSDALEAVRNANMNFLVASNFVEIVPHPNLNTAIRSADAGWSPAEIIVDHEDMTFDAKDLLEKSGGKKEFDPPNGIKYSLASTPFVTEESPQLELVLKETDYFTIKTIKNFLHEHHQYVTEFGSVVPEQNRIPSSLCLHYVVRTADGDILCMKRAKGMAYHSELWSITGEEQLAEHEVGKQAPIEKLFKRALCEEIFHLRNTTAFQDVVPLLDQDLSFLRILSVGIEVPLYNPTIVGIAQLSINTTELRKKLADRKKNIKHNAGNDDEGTFFILKKEDATKLLNDGSALVSGLFSQNTEELSAEFLHPTSRYRLFRVLRSALRKSLG